MLMRGLALCLVVSIACVASAAPPRVLLTNDDGYKAPGIRAIYKALTDAGFPVVMVAPATQQSGSSASITTGGVKISEPEPNIWAVEGRPADAVKVGIGYVMRGNLPDLVISGANFGQNVGNDTNLSGTVGAAIAAQQLGIPAIAISVEIKFKPDGRKDTLAAFPGAGEFLVKLLEQGGMPAKGDILNINYPALPSNEIKGVKLARLANYSIATSAYYLKEDGKYSPRLGVKPVEDPTSDAWLLSQGYITLTPIDGNLNAPVPDAVKSLVESLQSAPMPKAVGQ